MKAPLLLACVALAGCVVPISDEPIGTSVPLRSTVVDDTTTAPAGSVDVEAGLVHDPGDFFDSPVKGTYALDQRTEVFGAVSPYQHIDLPGSNADGPSDLVFGLKHRFQEETANLPSGAFEVAIKLPTASEGEGLSTGETDLFGSGLFTKRVADMDVSGAYRLGLLGKSGTDDIDTQHALAIGATKHVRGRIGSFGELSGIWSDDRDIKVVAAAIGATYTVANNLILDAGFRVGLSSDAPDLEASIGLTFNTGVLRRASRGTGR